jgi:hypothetical protein
MTNEELQAMLAAAYGGQINPANMGFNYGEPKSEWESYKYNQANHGRTAGDVEPKSIGWGEYAQEWYDRLIGTPLKGMAGAGDALLGRANPDLESFEKNVLDALSLYAGPSVAKSAFGKLPSQNTLNIFGGVGAKEAPLRMRDIAEKALSAGKDPDEVWKYTGWKPGMEGKMRFEIDDSKLKPLKNLEKMAEANDEGRLSTIIDHSELFKQYPEAKNLYVYFNDTNSSYFKPYGKDGIISLSKKRKSYEDDLIHEVQHAVQYREDFSKGSSVEYETIRAMNESPASEALFGEKAAEVGYQRYRNVAGEIEARDAAARRTWDTDMRRAVPPDMRKDAIIRMGDGGERQMSVDRFKVVPEMSGWSMGHKMYSADITENGKLIGGLTFSLSPDGIAKIGKISAFKGENTIGFGNLLKLKTELLEKVPGIKGFVGDRVGKHLKNPDIEIFEDKVIKELNY